MYNNKDGCSNEYHMNDMPIGMAYVPWQKFRNLYTPEKGLVRGTIFEELDKPFLGGACR